MADRWTSPLPTTYLSPLVDLKARILKARLRAVAAANRELVTLHFDIGGSIVERQEREGWGRGVIDGLAADLKNAFPEMKGFSPRNLGRMRAFFLAWRSGSEVLPGAVAELPWAVAELPWGHNALLLEKLADAASRLWYAEHAVERELAVDGKVLLHDDGEHVETLWV